MTREVLLKRYNSGLAWSIGSLKFSWSEHTRFNDNYPGLNSAIYMYIVNSKNWESEVNVYEMLMVDLFRNCLKWADCFFKFLKVKKKIKKKKKSFLELKRFIKYPNQQSYHL